MLVTIYQTSQRHNPEDSNLHSNHGQNLISRIIIILFNDSLLSM
jgi:hypothetical protein